MVFFESKEKKAKRLEAEANAKADAEFQAKYTAKQERKKVEKMVASIDGSISALISKAAAAKAKGYTQVYQQCISFIKVARARKMQAETFLFQMDAMQEMKALSENSKDLLNSMSNIMGTLGKLSLDPTVMMQTQKDLNKTQMELDKQGASIDTFLDGMQMIMPEDANLDTAQFDDNDIAAEIDAFTINNALNNIDLGSGTSSESSAANNELFAQVLNS